MTPTYPTASRGTSLNNGLILLHRLIAALHDNEVLVIHIG
jgi:hypothetical protein